MLSSKIIRTPLQTHFPTSLNAYRSLLLLQYECLVWLTALWLLLSTDNLSCPCHSRCDCFQLIKNNSDYKKENLFSLISLRLYLYRPFNNRYCITAAWSIHPSSCSSTNLSDFGLEIETEILLPAFGSNSSGDLYQRNCSLWSSFENYIPSKDFVLLAFAPPGGMRKWCKLAKCWLNGVIFA